MADTSISLHLVLIDLAICILAVVEVFMLTAVLWLIATENAVWTRLPHHIRKRLRECGCGQAR